MKDSRFSELGKTEPYILHEDLTGVALDEAHLVTVHTLESHQLRGEVVAMYALLGSVTHRTREQPVATTHLAHCAGISTLQHREKG